MTYFFMVLVASVVYFMDVTLKSLILGALREKYPALGIEDADLVDLRARKSR
jgi:hypothetical protein